MNAITSLEKLGRVFWRSIYCILHNRNWKIMRGIQFYVNNLLCVQFISLFIYFVSRRWIFPSNFISQLVDSFDTFSVCVQLLKVNNTMNVCNAKQYFIHNCKHLNTRGLSMHMKVIKLIMDLGEKSSKEQRFSMFERKHSVTVMKTILYFPMFHSVPTMFCHLIELEKVATLVSR